VSRILYAWEIGAGYGHVGAFLPLALELRKRGHDVVFAGRDLQLATTFLGPHGFRVLQAPVWLHDSSGLPPAVSYAELLFRFGFLDEHALMGMVRGWLTLFKLIGPDLVLVDHGPTALLAARSGPSPRALFGTGFYSPPRLQPLPSFRPWLNVPTERLLESERRVLEVINRVVDHLGGEPLSVLADLFRADEDFLCTFPELDHYPSRGPAHYWGPTFARHEGAPPEWPSGPGARILAYVLPTYRGFEPVLQSLADLPYRVLLHAPGMDAGAPRPRSRHGNVAFCPGLVQIVQAIRECDLIICHAGHGTVALSLLAGRPLVLLPIYIEQLLTSRNVVKYGAGIMVNPDSRDPRYRRLLQEAIQEVGHAERARRFAREHADFSPDNQLQALVSRCEALLS
jgi:hypothetical protein